MGHPFHLPPSFLQLWGCRLEPKPVVRPLVQVNHLALNVGQSFPILMSGLYSCLFFRPLFALRPSGPLSMLHLDPHTQPHRPARELWQHSPG